MYICIIYIYIYARIHPVNSIPKYSHHLRGWGPWGSRDGSETDSEGGLAIRGQPCVWCGGGWGDPRWPKELDSEVFDGFWMGFGQILVLFHWEWVKSLEQNSWEMEVHPKKYGIVGFVPHFVVVLIFLVLLDWMNFYGRDFGDRGLAVWRLIKSASGRTLTAPNLRAQVTNGFHGNWTTKQQLGQASESSRPSENWKCWH